jgi:hypothetical protein
MKKRMKVVTKQTSKFRRLCELAVSIDKSRPSADLGRWTIFRKAGPEVGSSQLMENLYFA